MMLATFESAGITASRSFWPTVRPIGEPGGNVELDHQHQALGEHIGLPCGGDPDEPRDRVGRLELGGDHEVDVELALAPDLEVLDVLRSHDRARVGRESLGEDPGDDVHLVARRAGDNEIGFRDPCVLENASTGPVALRRQDVVPVRERAESGGIGVHHGDRVLGCRAPR